MVWGEKQNTYYKMCIYNSAHNRIASLLAYWNSPEISLLIHHQFAQSLTHDFFFKISIHYVCVVCLYILSVLLFLETPESVKSPLEK